MDALYTSSLATDLGKISYEECLDLQLGLVDLRKKGLISDTVLFLEHDPPVYTIGRKSDPANWPGINPVKTDRGGDVTYHSPGQLVFYPILDLTVNGKIDVRRLVKGMEKVVIDALSDNGMETYVGEEPGIWTRGTDRKVASLGMAISGHVSYHGVAINLTPEPLEGFMKINPCGLDPSVMGYVGVSRDDMIASLMKALGNEFNIRNKIGRDDFLSLLSNCGEQFPKI